MTIPTGPTRPTVGEFRVECARRRSVLEERFAHVEPPADATTVAHWDDIARAWGDGPDGQIERWFRVSERTIGGVRLTVCGIQQADGSTSRCVLIVGDDELSATDARALGAALLDAANEVDGPAGVRLQLNAQSCSRR